MGGNVSTVPQSAVWQDVIIPESKWFDVDENQAYKVLNYVFKNQQEIKSKGSKLMYRNREKFNE